MQVNTLRLCSVLLKTWTLKPEELNSDHSSAPRYLCLSGKETTSLQALVSSSVKWKKKLDPPHKAGKLNEIPNICKEDMFYLQILCKERTEAEDTTWKVKTKWKFG